MFMKVYDEGLVFGSSWQRSNQKHTPQKSPRCTLTFILHSFILHFSFFFLKHVCPLNLNLNMFMKVYEGLVFGSSWQRSNQNHSPQKSPRCTLTFILHSSFFIFLSQTRLPAEPQPQYVYEGL
jgi:hypothetical protein